MIPVSIVIIAKNEAEVIGRCIDKAKLITNDVVIIDNGSTDGTLELAIEAGCHVYQKTWDGYAANKNKGIDLAQHDWILSIDADEVPDEKLIQSLQRQNLSDPNVVYDIKFKSYYGKKQIRFGKWGRDHHVRLFNRTTVRWSESIVHETLAIGAEIKKQTLDGNIHHHSVNDGAEFNIKATNYAQLCAKKYHLDGKKVTFVKLHLSPVFNFIKYYLLYLGFLDGKPGWEIASKTFKHTRLKYSLLKKMELADTKNRYIKDNLVYAYSAEEQMI